MLLCRSYRKAHFSLDGQPNFGARRVSGVAMEKKRVSAQTRGLVLSNLDLYTQGCGTCWQGGTGPGMWHSVPGLWHLLRMWYDVVFTRGLTK